MTTEKTVQPSVNTVNNIMLAVLAAKKQGYKLLSAVQYPRDSFLMLVICQWETEFVVWTFNTQGEGFSNGSYRSNYNTALMEFQRRLEGITR